VYKIEITADTLAELSGKVMTLAAKLHTGTATEAPRYTGPLAGEAEIDPIMPEVAEMAASDGAALVAAPHPTDAAVEVPQDLNPDALTHIEIEVPELNFETDVAPYVLQVVKEKGKPVAQEILSQFGVEKASLLDPAQWPELVDMLKDAINGSR
jgi:hypothetical protein